MSFFFGWYIVAAAVILTGYNSAMFVYGLTAFLAPIAAWVFDSTGGYFPIWYIYAGLTAAGTVLLLFLPEGGTARVDNTAR